MSAKRVVQLHTLERERGGIGSSGPGRTTGYSTLAEGFGSGIAAGTGARLELVLALSRFDVDDQIRAGVWATRWHEGERR